jgi:hypothetical protein
MRLPIAAPSTRGRARASSRRQVEGAVGSLSPAGGSTLRDGLAAGAFGAGVLALWMAGTDAAAGHPLATARLLGGPSRPPFAGDALLPVVAYFALHSLLLVAVALGVTTLVHRADDAPPVLVIAVLLLPLVLFFYTGLVAVLAQSRLGRMAWVQFGAGGVLTSIIMGWAVYRRHPAVRADWIRGRAEDA